jgi:hypothetical protein
MVWRIHLAAGDRQASEEWTHGVYAHKYSWPNPPTLLSKNITFDTFVKDVTGVFEAERTLKCYPPSKLCDTSVDPSH